METDEHGSRAVAKRLQNRIETRRAILEAALDLIEVQGYDDTTIEQISAAAGVSRATFFRYFETKAGVIREFHRRLTDDVLARMEKVPSPTSVQRLQMIADTVHDNWRDASAPRRRLGLEAAGLSNPTGTQTYPELYRVVLDVLRDGLTTGELKTDLPPPLAAVLALNHLAGAAVWWFTHPDGDLRVLLDDALAQCLRGLGVSDVSARSLA